MSMGTIPEQDAGSHNDDRLVSSKQHIKIDDASGWGCWFFFPGSGSPGLAESGLMSICSQYAHAEDQALLNLRDKENHVDEVVGAAHVGPLGHDVGPAQGLMTSLQVITRR